MQAKKVVLCVTGGIAAYKVVQVARDLAQMGADVRVVMTRSAERFVGAQTFAALTGNPVATELLASQARPDVVHVELARGADLAIVAPATANSIAKMALGFADDLFSATILTLRCPVLVAPAMHTEMWEHDATRRNVETLVARGVAVVGPAAGALSSGDEGPGRMVEAEEIVHAAAALLARSSSLEGKRVLVTAGATHEPIDAVRFIGNRSSGLMGTLIAREAAARGAKVTLVAGPTTVAMPAGADVVRVTTAQEMRDAVVAAAPDADVVVKAAAVADFKPRRRAHTKLKKSEGPPEVELVATPDILAELGTAAELRKPGSVLVGFAAETEADPGRLMALAADKRASKRADVIVANDVGSPDSGFEVSTARAVLAGPRGEADLGLVTKETLAAALLDEVGALLSS